MRLPGKGATIGKSVDAVISHGPVVKRRVRLDASPPSMHSARMVSCGARQIKRLGRQFLAGFAGAVLMLHALLPPGFMPDLRALGAGQFELIVCTGNGPVQTDPDKSKNTASDICAFGVTATMSFNLASAPGEAMVAFSVGDAPTSFGMDRIERLDAAGPPLGSRAPPHVFG